MGILVMMLRRLLARLGASCIKAHEQNTHLPFEIRHATGKGNRLVEQPPERRTHGFGIVF